MIGGSVLELLKKKTDELFKFFNSIAPLCGNCGKVYSCVAIRYGDIVIGIYSCDCMENAKNLLVYRGIIPKIWKAAQKIIGEKDLEELRTQESAAMAAKIICPRCQKPMKYMESAILPDGSVQHRFDCRNGFCPDFEKTIWTKLTRESCRRIFAEAEKDAQCRICHKIEGAKIHCPKEKGIICEEHCSQCEFHDNKTSKFICRFRK